MMTTDVSDEQIDQIQEAFGLCTSVYEELTKEEYRVAFREREVTVTARLNFDLSIEDAIWSEGGNGGEWNATKPGIVLRLKELGWTI